MSRTFNIHDFLHFLVAEHDRIVAAYGEVEELQKLYQGRYLSVRAEHGVAISGVAAQLAARSPEALGPTLAARAAERLPVEQAAIADRTKELAQLVPERQRAADLLLAKVQQEVTNVRTLNPELDCREEQLKAAIAGGQQKLDDLNAQVAGLAQGLGFISHAGRIRQLDRERQKVVAGLLKSQEDLGTVRNQWRRASTAAHTSESTLLDQWRSAAAELGELRQEQERLQQDPQALAWRRTCVYVLENLCEVPPDFPVRNVPVADLPAAVAGDASVPLNAQSEVGAAASRPSAAATASSHPRVVASSRLALQPVVDLNLRLADFQTALGSVAGILGLAKGMNDGLKAFSASGNQLQEQEAKYAAYLAPLEIVLPDETINFCSAWTELAERARDEQALAEHPADFVAVAAPYIQKRLSEAAVRRYFNTLSDAIKKATKAWG